MPWIIGGLILFFLALPVALTKLPRGLKNKNPGNLRKMPPSPWKGLAPAELQTDKDFYVFADADGQPGEFWGVRALARTILNYQLQHKLTTPAAMISRWAPPVENVTEAYIFHVAADLGVAPEQPVNLAGDIDAHVKIVKAIIKHENGFNPYSSEMVSAAVSLAREGLAV